MDVRPARGRLVRRETLLERQLGRSSRANRATWREAR